MIELADVRPVVDVQPAEYKRLLGYPRDWVFEDRAAELASAARDWYARNGRPWVYARHCKHLELAAGSVAIDGVTFTSPWLQKTLADAGAESVVLVAASAGPELEREAQQLWREEKPDEYFFLEVYGSAVVEQLITTKGAELCAWAESCDRAVLPHYSPGYAEWDVAEQPVLLHLIRHGAIRGLPGELDVLDSGMLRPKKSLLAVFGVTTHRERVARLTGLNPCERCSFLSCQYRRAPYIRTPRCSNRDDLAQAKRILAELPLDDTALTQNAEYSVNPKALARWATSRLRLRRRANGTTDALFRYEGTTCSNMGRPVHFDYEVTLGSREAGYVICAETCRPASGDQGYQSMCRYLEDAPQLMAAIEREKPLLGEPLNRVLTWDAARSNAGCYCELADRMHKWRLVLETIHFALANQESNGSSESR